MLREDSTYFQSSHKHIHNLSGEPVNHNKLDSVFLSDEASVGSCDTGSFSHQVCIASHENGLFIDVDTLIKFVLSCSCKCVHKISHTAVNHNK